MMIMTMMMIMIMMIIFIIMIHDNRECQLFWFQILLLLYEFILIDVEEYYNLAISWLNRRKIEKKIIGKLGTHF